MWEDVPLRTCPSCGTQARTRFDTCARCGARYGDAPPPSRPRSRARLVAGGAVAVVALAGAVAVLAQRGSAEREDQRRERAAALVAARARLLREQAPHRRAEPGLRDRPAAPRAQRLAARAGLLRAVETAITADARRRARAGELDGPIRHTECGPLLKDPEAVPDHRVPSRRIGRYDCVAVRGDVRNTTRRVARMGHAFVAAVRFDRGTFVWCRNNPPQGERGESLVHVRLERACLAARGRALGTGYVDVPDG